MKLDLSNNIIYKLLHMCLLITLILVILSPIFAIILSVIHFTYFPLIIVTILINGLIIINLNEIMEYFESLEYKYKEEENEILKS